MSDVQPQEEESSEQEAPENAKTYAEWREPLHRLFGKDAEPTDEDKKAGISAEGPFVSDHVSESSESEADSGSESQPDPYQSVPGQPTSQSGDSPETI